MACDCCGHHRIDVRARIIGNHFLRLCDPCAKRQQKRNKFVAYAANPPADSNGVLPTAESQEAFAENVKENDK